MAGRAAERRVPKDLRGVDVLVEDPLRGTVLRLTVVIVGAAALPQRHDSVSALGMHVGVTAVIGFCGFIGCDEPAGRTREPRDDVAQSPICASTKAEDKGGRRGREGEGEGGGRRKGGNRAAQAEGLGSRDVRGVVPQLLRYHPHRARPAAKRL